MICTNCGYDLLHVNRTVDRLITYCPQCGDERDSPRDKGDFEKVPAFKVAERRKPEDKKSVRKLKRAG